MSDLTPLPALAAGLYRHYKGGEYEVLAVVRHSETLEPLVLYRPLYNDSGLWGAAVRDVHGTGRGGRPAPALLRPGLPRTDPAGVRSGQSRPPASVDSGQRRR